MLVLSVAASAACERKAASEPARKEGVELGVRGASAAPAASASTARSPKIPPGQSSVRFAVIGDFGVPSQGAARVALLVRSDQPDFIITTGDNNYPDGEAETIDANIGRYYHEFIHPYSGGFGAGAKENRFFPCLGNHDWRTEGATPYLDYFTLPGNERYYDFVRGDVHFFAVDSDKHEPDGITSTSAQAAWLERALRASTAAWQVVFMHHPPFSSGAHGSSEALRWPYGQWGADLVLAGHDHHYERLERDGAVYVVNGLGGNRPYSVGEPIPGSITSYNENHGAQFIEASRTVLVSRFTNVERELVDEFTLTRKDD